MTNPFATLDIRSSRVRRPKLKSPSFPVESCIESIDTSTPQGIRDRVILLLRHKYMLRPSEISCLNVADVDLAGGLICMPNGRGRFVIIADNDLAHIRRWCSIRKLYAGGDDSLIISLHWTAGRSQPYRRIGVRGLFQIVEKYRVRSNDSGSQKPRPPKRFASQHGLFPHRALNNQRARAGRFTEKPN